MQQLLHSKNPFVRKAAAAALRAPRYVRRLSAKAEDYQARPPVFANSFPKSGTHLLDQILAALPHTDNLGAFLSSMTSSFQMRERSKENSLRWLESIVPGELVRGHLFYSPEYNAQLGQVNTAHYFIYRDPRDVIVSSCHYLRKMNPWHRLHKHFKQCATLEDAILLSIRGLPDEQSDSLLPDVAKRFSRYEGWVTCPDALALRFEDLTGDQKQQWITRCAEHYANRSNQPLDIEKTTHSLLQAMDPGKSHTYRSGKKGGWQEAFTDKCKDAFKETAGDLLVRLGYENDDAW